MPKPTHDHTRVILDSIADGVFTVDRNWRVTSFNRAAESITGISRADAVGRPCCEVFQASICEGNCSLRQTMETGKSVINDSIFIVNAQGVRTPVSISTALLRDRRGRIIGGVETFRDLSVVEDLRRELAGRHAFLDIISKNEKMRRLFDMLEMISGSDTTVLVEGESGTGKELFARAIHSLSHRHTGPLTVVNCGALPDSLLESELFGYKAGAFTDARRDKPGRIALAEGGTLFLDEIGDISQALQVRLLRVLQEKVYEPLGGVRPQKADVRIVAATHRRLEDLVACGDFREDLYYRIHVAKLTIPPLRERKEDIPLLIDHFIRKFSHLNGRDVGGIDDDVLALLMAHGYPGNVRELENILEYATVVCRGPRITMSHLPDHIRRDRGDGPRDTNRGTPPPRQSMRDYERELICRALEKNDWNRSATAADLGIHPTTLWRKAKRFAIVFPNRRGPSS